MKERPRAHGYRPKPTDLMDPDQTNAPGALDWSRSIRIWIQRPNKEESGSGLGWPDPSVRIKGFITRICPFSILSFLFLFRRCSVFLNPNPRFWNPTQNSMIQGLMASFHGSKHEFVTGFYILWLKRRRSRVLLRGIRTVLVHFFSFKSPFYVFFSLIRWFTTMNHRCKPLESWNFSKKVRVCDSEPNLHGFARFYVVMELVVVLERNKGVSWWFLPVFGSEIQPGSSEILVFDSVIDLGLISGTKLVIFPLLLLNWFGFRESFFPSSSQIHSVIVPDSLLLAMNLALELQRNGSMMMIHLNSWELAQFHWFCLHLVLEKKVRVHAFVLELFDSDL